jgi:hypothetical protein
VQRACAAGCMLSVAPSVIRWLQPLSGSSRPTLMHRLIKLAAHCSQLGDKLDEVLELWSDADQAWLLLKGPGQCSMWIFCSYRNGFSSIVSSAVTFALFESAVLDNMHLCFYNQKFNSM